jgi:hypothetical protein
MTWVFSDRLWFLKLALAAACFSGMCHRAKDEIAAIVPLEDDVPLRWAEWSGKSLHLGARRVIAERADGYEIQTEAGPATLLVPRLDGVVAGERVSATAVIEGPRTYRARELQHNRGFAWKRPLNYLLSIAVVAVVLWLARDRFRIRLREGLFRART